MVILVLMIKGLNTRVCIFLMCLSLFSCKHQQKQKSSATPKKSTVKTPSKPKNDDHSKPGEKALEEKLGLSSKDIHHNKFYSFVTDWYGVPYKYGGCKKEGVDCSCFASVLYSTVFNTTLQRTAGEMFKACEQIGPEDAKQGDLFFFKINGNQISHVGVCLKRNYFVHASTSKGVIINSIEEAYYKKYFFCAGRVKKT